MLRETYTALKQYEKIGPMASPFINDPTAIVARAFSELYPGVEYVVQYVPDLRDETNGWPGNQIEEKSLTYQICADILSEPL